MELKVIYKALPTTLLSIVKLIVVTDKSLILNCCLFLISKDLFNRMKFVSFDMSQKSSFFEFVCESVRGKSLTGNADDKKQYQKREDNKLHFRMLSNYLFLHAEMINYFPINQTPL